MPARRPGGHLRCGLIVSIAAAALFASVASAADSRSRAALERAAEAVVAAPGGPPAISLEIRRPRRTEFLGRGLADVERAQPPARRDRVRIASVAKAFNGAVALSLVSSGRLALDDTVGELLPGLLPKARRVTLGEALDHTAGLPDYIRDEAFVERLQRNPTGYATPRKLVSFVRDEPLRFRPGSRYGYSDTDNIVVALMAEKATGRSYEQLLRRRVYGPLGLRSTSLPETVRMPAPYMPGYEIEPDAEPEDVTETLNPALAWASGGIVSDLRDVGRFFRGYVGGRLFDDQTLRAQHTFVVGSSQPPGPGRNDAGLAIFRYRTRCGTVFGHTGSFPGYRLFSAATRDGRRSATVFVNAQIVPGRGSDRVSDLIREAQQRAVCRMLE